ncbi:fumarylacetoacetate hydrolase family protein [Tsukamurella spumae]|uniref:Fumarylacetoacetate hydrolase family protein n=1 Tax=Tsukamurella spumae TaxID=44753 RepID=A0A846X7P2_9ACTN|nr:fumarylacetoacetate hydrolase family protein [Tsukamurella spumae]NKY19770.1 fumarylacetoacetate hydrolase family protein [Tsukamurella spumae]
MWTLVTYQAESTPPGSPATSVAFADDDGTYWSTPELSGYADVGAVARDWPTLGPVLRGVDPRSGTRVAAGRIVAPFPAPGKLICAGANYTDHLREMGIDSVPPTMEPFFFLLPSTSISAPDDTVDIPSDPAARVDWEAELGVVIGARAKEVTVEEALDRVAGYTVVNDISSRGRHRRPDPLAPPFAFDWLASKGADGFTPIGPGLRPAWFIEDPRNLSIKLWRNDVNEQDGNTSDMIFDVAQLISAASHRMTLEPGDVIATGTPAGVGAGKESFLADGDVLRIEIAGVGSLRNTMAGKA